MPIRPPSLATALLVILLFNPYAIASVSLQLSFPSMLGLILVTPRVYQIFSVSASNLKNDGRGPCAPFLSYILLYAGGHEVFHRTADGVLFRSFLHRGA